MARLFGRVPRIVGTALGTIAVGALTGFLLSGAVSSTIAERGWFSASNEVPMARAFMLQRLQHPEDPATTSSAASDVVGKALAQQAGQANAERIKPLSLTYLGGASRGQFIVQLFAVEQQLNDGSKRLTTYALTLYRGKVVEIR